MSAILGGTFVSCSKQDDKAAQQAQPPAPVAVAVAVQKSVPVELHGIGNVQPLTTVQIRSQITGALDKAHFKAGQFVKQGDLLFTIDPRPFQAVVNQAIANMARDKVQAENAEIVARRTEKAFHVQAASQDELDQTRTDAAAKLAAVQADEAAVQSAQLQMQYCYIHSPVDGRAGDILIDPGNQIKANDLPMVTINQIEPITVQFSLPQQDLDQIRRCQASGNLPVRAILNNDESHPIVGALTMVDNQVDTATGTFQLKATFPNQDQRLWPGQFADVVLTATVDRNVVVVPFSAIQSGQEGNFVFVVKDDQTVESRPVKFGRMLGTSVIVLEGVAAGDRVVTDGQIRLRPGATAAIQRTDPVELPADAVIAEGPETMPANGPATAPAAQTTAKGASGSSEAGGV